MIITIPDFLTEKEIQEALDITKAVGWHAGENPNPEYRKKVKRNQEIRESHSKYSDTQLVRIRDKIATHPELRAKISPRLIVVPQFNKYAKGDEYGKHADSHRLGKPPLRTDLSITLFLSNSDEYDGGMLTLEYGSGEIRQIKEPKGTLVCYPSGVLHYVTPVTRGARIAAVTWLQSWLRDPGERELIASLASTMEKVKTKEGLSDTYMEITALYHSLMRKWSDS